MRRYKAAISDRNKQVEAHRGFTDSLPTETAEEWEAMCVQWDADGFPKSQPNPYVVDGAGEANKRYMRPRTNSTLPQIPQTRRHLLRWNELKPRLVYRGSLYSTTRRQLHLSGRA